MFCGYIRTTSADAFTLLTNIVISAVLCYFWHWHWCWHFCLLGTVDLPWRVFSDRQINREIDFVISDRRRLIICLCFDNKARFDFCGRLTLTLVSSGTVGRWRCLCLLSESSVKAMNIFIIQQKLNQIPSPSLHPTYRRKKSYKKCSKLHPKVRSFTKILYPPNLTICWLILI